MGKKKNKKNKIGLSVSSTDEEIVKETSVIEVVCPTCKRMLELKNELKIKNNKSCKCSCIPTSFKISKNDKKMNIDKTKDSINLETDVHSITLNLVGKQHQPIIMKTKLRKLLNKS